MQLNLAVKGACNLTESHRVKICDDSMYTRTSHYVDWINDNADGEAVSKIKIKSRTFFSFLVHQAIAWFRTKLLYTKQFINFNQFCRIVN